jgi:hypothetical protein
MDRIIVTMEARVDQTRVLMMEGRNEMMRAVLGPSRGTHPRAAATLLEGLALWHQQALSVVLSADVEGCSSALRLCDSLGIGERNVHYEVEIALREHRRRAQRLGGLGSFRDLRQLCLEGVMP